jgi:hypothetical protein
MADAGETDSLSKPTKQGADVVAAIQRLTEGEPDARADAYADLMRREERVLRTVDRVVNASRQKVVEDAMVINRPLNELAKDAMRSLHLVIHDLLHVRKPADVLPALTHGPRKIYVGALLIALAFVVFFSTVAS